LISIFPIFLQAISLDPHYSAAWKLYARALANSGKIAEAVAAYEHGITIAETRGDIQAAKEMQVFLKRLKKQLSHMVKRTK
jgi:predicted Zn-dependent protease